MPALSAGAAVFSSNAGYQYKIFEDRSRSDFSDENQRDHLLTYGGSLFYDIMPHVSVGATVDYSKNRSNENVETYDNLVVSSGIYRSF